MFHPVEGDLTDRLIANYLRMLLFVILSGFALVVMKLFEVMGVVAVIVLWIALRRSQPARVGGVAYVTALLFDLLESPRTVVRLIRETPKRLLENGRKIRQRLAHLRPSIVLLESSTFLFLILISCYIRLYSAVSDPTPKMSDGDTLLAWIKYIDFRYLMHDGVYPQGLFFALAVIGKFAVINPLFILNYTGPLDSIMIILMMYYGIVRLTNSRLAGLVAVFLYGVLGQHLLLFEWMRQSGSETQEFGFPLVFPVLYFLDRYLRHGRQVDLWVVSAGAADAGLIHPLSFMLTLLASISVMVAHSVVHLREVKRRLPYVLLSGTASGVVALLPYGLAYVYHIQANQGAQSFLSASLTSGVSASGGWNLAIPSTYDTISFICILWLLIMGFYGTIQYKTGIPWFIAGVWGFVCYGLYEFGPTVTKSVILMARMIDLWAITEAFTIAMGLAALLTMMHRFAILQRIIALVVLALVVLGTIIARPGPIMPYDVQWPDDVEAYLQINNQFRSSDYMIVSPQFEYALVYGSGFQMDRGVFLKEFDPTKKPITLYGQKHPDKSLAPYVFVYYYKHIFRVSRTNGVYAQYASFYHKEVLNNARIRTWIQTLSRTNHETFKVVYNGPDLEVYEIPVDFQKSNPRQKAIP